MRNMPNQPSILSLVAYVALLMFAMRPVLGGDDAPLWRYEQGGFVLQCRLKDHPEDRKVKLFEVEFKDDHHQTVTLLRMSAASTSASKALGMLDDFRPVFFSLSQHRIEFVTNWDGVRAFVWTREKDDADWSRVPRGPLGTIGSWNGGAAWARIWVNAKNQTGMELVNQHNEYGIFYLVDGVWKRKISEDVEPERRTK